MSQQAPLVALYQTTSHYPTTSVCCPSWDRAVNLEGGRLTLDPRILPRDMACFILRAAGLSCSPFLWRHDQLDQQRNAVELYFNDTTFTAAKLAKFRAKVAEVFDFIGGLILDGKVFNQFPIEPQVFRQLKFFGCCENHLLFPPPSVWSKRFVVDFWQVLITSDLFPQHARQSFGLTNIKAYLRVFDILDAQFERNFSPALHVQYSRVSYLLASSFVQYVCSHLCGHDVYWGHEIQLFDNSQFSVPLNSQFRVATAITTAGLVALQSFYEFNATLWFSYHHDKTFFPFQLCKQFKIVLQSCASHWAQDSNKLQGKPIFDLTATINESVIALKSGLIFYFIFVLAHFVFELNHPTGPCRVVLPPELSASHNNHGFRFVISRCSLFLKRCDQN